MALHPIPVENSLYRVSGGAFVSSISTATIIDDFNDEDLSEYNLGTPADWTTGTSNTQEGAARLESSLTDGNNHLIGSTTGLDNYFQKGQKSRLYVWSDTVGFLENDVILAVKFGVQDLDNLYHLQFNFSDDDNWFLFENVGGSFNQLAGDGGITGDFLTSTWMRVDITWDDGSLGGSEDDITCELFTEDGNTLKSTLGPVNNSQFATETGIGFNYRVAETGATVAVDNWRVI